MYGGSDVALKLFRGAATSDGLPEDEIKVMQRLGPDENSVSILGSVVGAPEGQLAALLPLVPPSFTILGNPPTFDSCTRDTYPEDKTFSLRTAIEILEAIARVCAHLHSRGLSHGDLYAHNILVQIGVDGEPTRTKLSDYGAASFSSVLKPHQVALLERIEVRAFGALAEELMDRLEEADAEGVAHRLSSVIVKSMRADVASRPSFSEIHQEMVALLKEVVQ